MHPRLPPFTTNAKDEALALVMPARSKAWATRPSNLVFTDDYPAYDGLAGTQYNYYHRRIRHSEKVYVAGEVHTQTIEGFWSLVKNGIKGVYHSVGCHYLQTYLNEYSFRYNRRFDEQPMFTSFLYQIEKRDQVIRKSEIPVEPF
jgi:ISXO2 transposase-like protein